MKKIIALFLVMSLSIFGVTRIFTNTFISEDITDVGDVDIPDPNSTTP